MTASRVARQSRAYPQFEKCGPAAPWSFPLPPESHSKSQPDPASKLDEYLWRVAEAEIAAPTPHIGGQLLHCRLDADAFCSQRDLPDPPLKTIQGLWRNDALDLWSVRKAESEELSLLWSRNCALRLVHFELEFLRDEPRDALHHSLTRSLTTHVDIAIVGVANVTVSASHQLSVEFVEHEVTEQRRKWAPLWGPFHAGT